MGMHARLIKLLRSIRYPLEIPSRIANKLEVSREQIDPPSSASSMDDGKWLMLFHDRLGLEVPCDDCSRFDPVMEEIVQAIRPFGSIAHDLDRSVGRVLWALMTHLGPSVVLETGVARGVSSRLILEVLESRGEGNLWSIDLPPLAVDPASVGVAVPQRLKQRWRYVRGNSRAAMRRVLMEAGGLDGFIHDSLHTYRTMRYEFTSVEPYLEDDSFLLADDVDGNRAFEEFARDHPDSWSEVISHETKGGAFGVMVFAGKARTR